MNYNYTDTSTLSQMAGPGWFSIGIFTPKNRELLSFGISIFREHSF